MVRMCHQAPSWNAAVALDALLIIKDTVLTVLVLLQARYKELHPQLKSSQLKCCQTRAADHGLGLMKLWIGWLQVQFDLPSLL